MDIAVGVCPCFFHMEQMAAGCDMGESLYINCLGADNHPHTVLLLATEPVQRWRTLPHISSEHTRVNTHEQHVNTQSSNNDW